MNLNPLPRFSSAYLATSWNRSESAYVLDVYKDNDPNLYINGEIATAAGGVYVGVLNRLIYDKDRDWGNGLAVAREVLLDLPTILSGLRKGEYPLGFNIQQVIALAQRNRFAQENPSQSDAPGTLSHINPTIPDEEAIRIELQ